MPKATTAARKVIPFKVDDETREGYVENIIDAFGRATEDQKQRGRTWYQTAHDLANLISDGNVREGAGVIAALSANKSWKENERLARGAYADKPSGHTRDNIRKVERIMLGDDPEDVLPMSAKTGHFFRCILDPEDPDPVVIDRHAHDIAINEVFGNSERGLESKQRYALLAHCYREAALRMEEIPSVVQAVTWVAHTERLTGSRFRPKNR
ncbi:DUF7178 family protein [Streptomyces sp. NBC_01760]|uniref:DUF7178 family protein n=1 Tax=Streptomyces sp. NBC_01760 TaxID=2975931 RepID=UPI002DDB177B|nr:hypothetical protein [Streptomyces sp. NBC_01760]WSC72227.1 hypothetical protein OG807_29175 [Streptomyces sp. NBC_01760]